MSPLKVLTRNKAYLHLSTTFISLYMGGYGWQEGREKGKISGFIGFVRVQGFQELKGL